MDARKTQPSDRICETEFNMSKFVDEEDSFYGPAVATALVSRMQQLLMPSISSLPAGAKRSNLLQAASFIPSMEI